MKSVTFMDKDKLVATAVNLLMRKLGPVETARFLALRPLKRLDSVALHRARQSKWDKDEFFSRVFNEKTRQHETKIVKRKVKTAIAEVSFQRAQ